MIDCREKVFCKDDFCDYVKKKFCKFYNEEGFEELMRRCLGKPLPRPSCEGVWPLEFWRGLVLDAMLFHGVADAILKDEIRLEDNPRLMDLVHPQKHFVEEDFPPRARSGRTEKEFEELKRLCVGKPVFAPDYEDSWVLDNDYRRHVATLIADEYVLGESILSGEVKLEGQPLTSWIPAAAVERDWRQPDRAKVTSPHFVGEPDCWSSYHTPWVRGCDFGETKPSWQTSVDDSSFFCHKALYDMLPVFEMPPDDQDYETPFYNHKHYCVWHSILMLDDAEYWNRREVSIRSML